jgi:hypothetical protein
MVDCDPRLLEYNRACALLAGEYHGTLTDAVRAVLADRAHWRSQVLSIGEADHRAALRDAGDLCALADLPVQPEKHTPGPWTVNGFGGNFERLATLAPAGVVVSAETAPLPSQEIPNARLIAMAPALLESHERLLDAVYHLRLCRRCSKGPLDGGCDGGRAALEAVAAAEKLAVSK